MGEMPWGEDFTPQNKFTCVYTAHPKTASVCKGTCWAAEGVNVKDKI